MCKFISGLGLKNGDLIVSKYTDSHEDLIDSLSLKDMENNLFQRLEYSPKKENDFIGEYILSFDNYKEIWVNEELIKSWTKKFEVIKNKRVITKNNKILMGGAFVLVGDITIKKLGNCCVLLNAGSATIEYADSATIEHANSATIKYAGSATIEDAGSATIEHAGLATIKYAGSATITKD